MDASWSLATTNAPNFSACGPTLMASPPERGTLRSPRDDALLHLQELAVPDSAREEDINPVQRHKVVLGVGASNLLGTGLAEGRLDVLADGLVVNAHDEVEIGPRLADPARVEDTHAAGQFAACLDIGDHRPGRQGAG